MRKYICIEGMSEVVATFVSANDINEARKVQKRLINDYKADFGTHLNESNEIEINEFEKTRILDCIFINSKTISERK